MSQPNSEIEDKIDSRDEAVHTEQEVAYANEGYNLIYGHESGGKVWQHELVDVKAIDYNDLLEIAIDKAQVGCEIHILPTLPEHHALRRRIFANAKDRKCPDLKIDGRYTEIKIPIGILQPKKISRNIKVAHAQANDVIIKLNSPVTLRALHEVAKGRFLTHQTLTVVEFKMEGRYYRFERSNVI